MKEIRNYRATIKVLIILAILGLFFSKSATLLLLTYIFVFLLLTVRTLVMQSQKKIKAYLISIYGLFLATQIVAWILVGKATHPSFIGDIASRIFCISILWYPFIVEKFVTINKYAEFYMPSVADVKVVSFSELKENMASIKGKLKFINKAGKNFNPNNIKNALADMPRHSAFEYISKNSLPPEYFTEAATHLDDPYIYIIISNTGSTASELISTFTQRQHNHASLCFDYDLKTIVSYNGGESVYEPGLNLEAIEYFNKKEDSSIIVYKLPCTRSQKEFILEKIKEINREGSAYNVIGLVVKYSHKPNIMFCSQFVYKILKLAGLDYFEADGYVKPTDLVELDYYRKLEFAYELMLKDRPDAKKETTYK